ncbi:MAG: response regulator transcription factor, partial [Alphaproteobacteria bacterium]
SYVSPNLAAQLLGASIIEATAPEIPTQSPFSTLTPREADILPLLVKGYSNKEIARSLGISEKTIKYHLTHLLKKLGVRNRVEAALIASHHLRGDPRADLSSP